MKYDNLISMRNEIFIPNLFLIHARKSPFNLEPNHAAEA